MADNVIDIRTRRPVTNVAARDAAKAVPGSFATRLPTRLTLGVTLEIGTLRTHRYSDHLVLWDLTNAGKRGKKVAKINVTPSYTVGAAHRDAIMEQIAILLESLQSFAVAAAVLGELAIAPHTVLDLNTNELRGIDVAPASFKTITIKTETMELTAAYDDFSIRCLLDKKNLPTAIPPIKHGKKSIPQFYAWVAANQDRIKTMSYRQVVQAMLDQGIKCHRYCAMD